MELKHLVLAAGLLMVSAGAVMASATDDRIESAARDSYVFKTYLKDDRIDVDAKDGVVVLTGTVATDTHRSMAEQTIASLPDVVKVENNITVSGEAPAKDSDAWIALKVKAALLFHQHVSATHTKVSVKDGIVTLEGEADSQAQKDLTAAYAEDVEGVKGVRNDISIAKAPRPAPAGKVTIDDASITGQVKMALLAHRSTSAINTKVRTENGVVIVTGKAKNAAEKALVTKLISDIDGVKSIRNDMEVM